MMKKILLFCCLIINMIPITIAFAEEPVRIKCGNFTMNTPTTNIHCYQIDDNIPMEEGASEEELAKAQVANTAIYFSDMESISSSIAPQVTFYRIDDLGKTSFDLLDISMTLNDFLNNLSSGYNDISEYYNSVPFLPFQAKSQQATGLAEQLDFEGGTGIRTITVFDDKVFASSGLSNLYYSYQGISSDGVWYVSAVFPLTSNSLNETDTSNTNWEYLTGDDFRPSLDQLDFYIRSIVIE